MIADDSSERARFITAARSDGHLPEGIIAEFYKRYARTWSRPCFVIDGGAHVGLHTLQLAQIDRVSTVYAVEAHPGTVKRLRARIEELKLEKKIVVVAAALQDQQDRDRVPFCLSTTHPGRSGIKPILVGAQKTSFNEPFAAIATTIDRIAANGTGRCGFIKLDLEGGEYHALLGGKSTLTRHGPACVFENGSASPKMNNYTVDELRSYFDSCGLVPVTFFGDPFLESNADDFWYAWAFPKASAEGCLDILRAVLAPAFDKLRQ